VVAGYSGPNSLFTSKDGTHWKNGNFAGRKYLVSVVYAGNQFVAVGDSGTVLTSVDGENWIKRNSLTGNKLQSISYGEQQYVAVGTDATVVSSPDGIVWQKEALEPDYWLFGVAYLKDRFLEFGSYSTMFVSGEGVTAVRPVKKHDRGVKDIPKIIDGKNCAFFIPPLNDRNQCSQVTIIALNGKLMYSFRMKPHHGMPSLPTERFPAGVYAVMVNNTMSRFMRLVK
jgi:hypothetical protein